MDGAKELHELFGSARGKSIHGVGDDVRMDVILEIKRIAMPRGLAPSES